jgi:hypothetical protein
VRGGESGSRGGRPHKGNDGQVVLKEGPAPDMSGRWQAAALRHGRGVEGLPVGWPLLQYQL